MGARYSLGSGRYGVNVDPTGRRHSALTPFQVEVAQLFFALPASEGFLLAGGAALLAHGLTTRPTRDLDFFAKQPGDVVRARDQLEEAVTAHGWAVERIRDATTFCRLVVHGPSDVLIDLAIESPPSQPAVVSVVGPTFAPEELAGRKLLALFDRAEARDFTDVYLLAERYGRDLLFAQAAALDAGLDRRFLAGQFATIQR